MLLPSHREIAQEFRDADRLYQIEKSPAPNINEIIEAVAPKRTAQQQAAFNRLEDRESIISVLNLPCLLIQLPYVILRPSKEEWVPLGMDLSTWRAITWPLVAILFWWSVGRGFDALLAARRGWVQPKISSIETAAGAAMFLLCAVIALALLCLQIGGRTRPDFLSKLLPWGFVLWALLGGAMVITRLQQWRISRRAA